MGKTGLCGRNQFIKKPIDNHLKTYQSIIQSGRNAYQSNIKNIMKFTTEQMQILGENVEGFFKESDQTKEQWVDKYKSNGLGENRFLWDLFHATGLQIGDGRGFKAQKGRFADGLIIGDFKDSHITTALRQAVGRHYLKPFHQ